MVDWSEWEVCKTKYNEGDRISDISNPLWDVNHEFSGVPITSKHIPCGYWSKGYDITVSPAYDAWIAKADFTSTRLYGVAASAGEVLFTGLGEHSSYCDDWWKYLPSTDTWQQVTAFGGGIRGRASAATVGTKIYVGLGSAAFGSSEKDWWEYDTVADTWTQKADYNADTTFAVAVGCGTKVYVGTGYTATKDWWEYNPATNGWTQKTDFGGSARYAAVGVELNGFIYVGLGIDSGSNELQDWWKYDPDADSWVQIANFGYRLGFAVAVAVGGKIYAGTGFDQSSNPRDYWKSYNPDTGIWTTRTAFEGSNRRNGIAAVADNKIFVGTGYNDDAALAYKDWWRYVPQIN